MLIQSEKVSLIAEIREHLTQHAARAVAMENTAGLDRGAFAVKLVARFKYASASRSCGATSSA